MKYTSLAALSIALLLNATHAEAQTHAAFRKGTAIRTITSDEAAIRHWLDRWAKVFSAHDLNGIKSLYAPDVVAYDLVPPLEYRGRDAYLKDYSELLSQYDGPIAVEYRDLHVVTSGNLGFAAGLEQISGTLKGGEKSAMWARFTSEFRKVKGRWLDFHDHVSVPVDMATGKAALDLKPPKD